jgi:hypothetical protein
MEGAPHPEDPDKIACLNWIVQRITWAFPNRASQAAQLGADAILR